MYVNMSCKAALYAVGTNVQTVTADESLIKMIKEKKQVS